LSIKPKSKISHLDVMMHMRNHYEGTALDPRFDVGAGPSGSAFRVRPINWQYKNISYIHERTIGTQQAAWNFVAQLRGNLPAPIGGRIWFGVDDATFSVHVPFHGGATRVPRSFADGTGDALTFSADSAFWAFNTVANFIYPRWFLAEEVITRAHAAEVAFEQALVDEERHALELHEKDPAKAIEYLTASAVARGDEVVKAEFALFGELMVKYRDGFKVSSQGSQAPDHGGEKGGVVPNVDEVGYSEKWYARIVQETGDHYKMSDAHTHPDLLQANKLRILAKGTTAGSRGPQAARASIPTSVVLV